MRRSNARIRVDSKPKTAPNTIKMDPIKLHVRPTSRNPKQTSFKSSIASIFAILALLSFACYSLLFANTTRLNYKIIIDGGSTGTRVHVFMYRGGKKEAGFAFDKRGLLSMRVNPGLSAYAEIPENAGESLVGLLEFSKAQVPEEYWPETEIWLMATAGLRLLDLGIQERILDSCRRVLSSSGFKFRHQWASVITGSDEGTYAWVVANYALGSLGGDPLQTTGIIELGGASAQVTFVSNEPMPPEFSRAVNFGNFTYNLYSHSFLHYGLNAAFESFKESLVAVDFNLDAQSIQKAMHIDPCAPNGYLHDMEWRNLSPGSLSDNKHVNAFQSKGNFSECRSAALSLLQKGKEKCSYESCNMGSTFMPKLQGKFLATENFFYTSKFFGLGPRAVLSELMMSGQQFCGEDWSKLKKKHQSLDDEDLLRYCFSSAYIVALLNDSLGIALDDDRIQFANKVENISLDWALGAFILQSTADLDIQQPNWINSLISDDSRMLLSLVSISIILLIMAWSISKWKQPLLKTVYDLEKGRS
ncbi:GDA1_CD39 domain-containing protein [Cephalotus follicularis]|uniref:GDA1_CD39 domain-containing protein n=1 Tax=Cephalotus follicularis TaxID=3775 RepID=A0A1Q3C5M5_CEPFO|nr:GDA1_CD39 domain-containing protein [Cephalotus follicularis]